MDWVKFLDKTRHTYSACEATASIKNVIVKDLIEANETVRKVKSETVSLKIIGVQDKGHVLFDSTFGNLKNRCSQ